VKEGFGVISISFCIGYLVYHNRIKPKNVGFAGNISSCRMFRRIEISSVQTHFLNWDLNPFSSNP